MTAADIHREYFKVYDGERDVDGLVELFHPDYAYSGPGGARGQGPDFALRLAGGRLAAFPDHTIEIVNHWAPRDDISIMEIIARGTQLGPLNRMGIPPTGKRMESPGVTVIETRDGKIYRQRDYFDTGTIRQKLTAT